MLPLPYNHRDVVVSFESMGVECFESANDMRRVEIEVSIKLIRGQCKREQPEWPSP